MRELYRGKTHAPSAAGAGAAIETYHSLLSSDSRLYEESQEALFRAHADRGLMIQDRLLCNVLRPRFMDREDQHALAQVAETISGVLERFGNYLLDSDAAMDQIEASDAEREIWAIDPGFSGLTLTSRLDAFVRDGKPRFIEYNAESPAGIGFCDCLTEIFEGLPAMRVWNDAPAQPADGRARLLQVLLDAYSEWGGTGTPSIAVVDWEDVLTRRDFELCAEEFRERGLQVVICDPRELTYRHGRLCHSEEKIDLVYRRVLLHELLERADEARQLLDSYRDGAVCMVNSPRSKLLHKKTIFALLSEGGPQVVLTEREQEAVNGTIPWTRRVRSGTTSWDGSTVDLMSLLVAEKDRFVVKPVDDYGGRGVVLGWESSRDDWEQSLEAADGGGYIVQERVDIPEEPFPVIRDGALHFEPLKMDTNPLLFKNRMGAVLTRLSGSALLNVTAGTGSTTPTFVLGEA